MKTKKMGTNFQENPFRVKSFSGFNKLPSGFTRGFLVFSNYSSTWLTKYESLCISKRL